MSAPEQHSTETLSPHDHEQESKTVAEKGQQRAFIDLLTDDDEQKQ